MRLERMIWSALMVAAFLLLPGCESSGGGEHPHPKLLKRLGVSILESLEDPAVVTYFQVTPDWASESRFRVSSKEKELPSEMRGILQETLLDDQSYEFNQTKMCLFVPELGFRFSGKHEAFVIVSFTCRQIQFISKRQKHILDIDPHFSTFQTHFRELLTHF